MATPRTCELTQRFGRFVALDPPNPSVGPGEIFGLPVDLAVRSGVSVAFGALGA